MIELDTSNFRATVESGSIVVVECWAPGCGVCAQFDPVFAKVAADFGQHTFARMNISTDDDLAELFGIEYTPAILLYRDALLLLKKPGNFSEEALRGMIQQAESLDMDRVRADVAVSAGSDADSTVRS